jgi:predicted O-methyltransferase YrrM
VPVRVLASLTGVRADLPGLSFAKFTQLYGGSFRTKHLVVVPPTARGRIGLAARFLLGRLDMTNKRAFSPSAESRLPADFIRLDPWEAEYLYLCAQRAHRGIVEIGRFDGGSTFLLACANRNVPIWSIDLDPRDDERLRGFFAENGVGRNVELIVGDSHRGKFPEIGEYDLLFVDGDHSYRGAYADLEAFVPRLAGGGHLLLHDCYAESTVQSAVLDFAEATDLEVIRPPDIPSSHWQTSYGSMAHFTKPPTTVTRRALRSLRPQLVAAAIGAMVLLACLLMLLPEELGDRPYNVF